MIYIKKFKIFSYFFLFFVTFSFIFTFNFIDYANAEIFSPVLISGTLINAYQKHDIIRASNGSICAIWIQDTSFDVYARWSEDDGITWGGEILINSSAVLNANGYLGICITSNDTIFIAVQSIGLSPLYVIRYYSDGSTNDPSISDSITTGAYPYYLPPVIYADEDNNIHLIYGYYNPPNYYLTYRIRTDILKTWSSGVNVFTGTIYHSDMIVYNDVIYVGFQNLGGGSTYPYRLYTMNVGGGSFTSRNNWDTRPSLNGVGNEKNLAMTIDTTNEFLYIAYQSQKIETGFYGINISKINILNWSYTNIELYHTSGYTYQLGGLYVDTNELIYTFFWGTTAISGNNQCLYVTCNNNLGDISALYYITSGSDQNMRCYLRNKLYPSFARLQTGFEFSFIDATGTTELWYQSTSGLTFGSGGGSPEEESDIYGNTYDYSMIGNYEMCDFGEIQIHNDVWTTKQSTYNLNFNGEIGFVDILIDKSDYENNLDMDNNMDLYVEVGHSEWKSVLGATYVVPYNDDWVIFRYDLNDYNCPNSYIIFDFYYPDATFTGYGVSECDINNDAILYFGYGNVGLDYSKNAQNKLFTHDLGVRFWANYNMPIENPLIDSITFNLNEGQNANVGYPVQITVTTSEPNIDNCIKIFYKDGSDWKENLTSGFPICEIGKSNFWFSFTSDYATSYDVVLVRNDINITHGYFNSTGSLPIAFVFTNPNPSKKGSSVNIYAFYSGSLTYDVRVRVKNYDEIEFFDVNNNESINLIGTTHFDYGGQYDIYIERRLNSSYSYSVIGNKYVHNVKETELSGSLSLGYYDKYQETWDMDLTQTIFFSHNQLGNDKIKVYINNGLVKISVGFSTQSSVTYLPPISGQYDVSLVLETSIGKQYLCNNVSFYAYYMNTSIPDESNKDWEQVSNLINNIPMILKIIFGFLIVFLFVLAPIGIAHAFNMENLPTIVYILSACVGLLFATAIGFLPIYVPFFIVIIAIIYVFLIWYNGQSMGGNGS